MNFIMNKQNTLHEDYDPFHNPPDIYLAVRHAKSNMVGAIDNSVPDDPCLCCYRAVNKKQFDIRCHQKELLFLGSPFVAYFQIIKITVCLLVLLFIGFAGLLISRLANSQCCSINVQLLLFLRFDAQMSQSFFVNLFMVLLLSVLMFFIKKYYNNQIYILQKDNVGPQNYAIQISGLPNCDQLQLKTWIKDQFGQSPKVIHLIYDIRDLIQAYDKKQQLTLMLLKNQLSVSFDGKQSLSLSLISNKLLDKKQHELLAEIEKEEQVLNKYKSCMKIVPYLQSGKAIVVFQKVSTVKSILGGHKHNCWEMFFASKKSKFFTFKQKQITIKKAPNPKDMMWQNSCEQNQTFHLIFYCIFSVLMIILLLLAIIFLEVACDHFQLKNNYKWLISTILTVYGLFHIFLHCLVQFSAKLRKDDTYTAKQIKKFLSYSCFNILFTCIVPYSLNLSIQMLVITVNLLLFFDAFLHPFIKLFNIGNIYRKIHSDYINHLPSNQNPYTQDYLNKLMEGFQFKLGQNFHYILRGIFISIFYIHQTPFGLLFYCISFGIQYWAEKYLLLRKCKVPPKHSQQLSDTFMKIFAFLPVIYILGFCSREAFVKQKQLINLHTCFLMIIALMSSMLTLYFLSDNSVYQPSKSFSQMQQCFMQHYQFQNPIKKFNGDLKHTYNLCVNKSKRSFDDLISSFQNKVGYKSKMKKIDRLASFCIDLGESAQYRKN